MPNRKNKTGWYRLPSGGLWHGTERAARARGGKPVPAKTAEAEAKKNSGSPAAAQSVGSADDSDSDKA